MKTPLLTTTGLLTATGIRKSFATDGQTTEVLHGIDLSVDDGEFVAVMGPSGSGKSTLLYAISGMDEVDAGTVVLDGTDLTALTPDELADARRQQMGFVFQQPNLLKDLVLLDNIVLTSSLDRLGTPAERVARAEELMGRVGIWDLRDRMPAQVSGGQLQRAGICRALMRRPRIVFGDEPTGALNTRAASEIMDLLAEFHAEAMTLLLVTHDAHVAARADRVVFMVDGEVSDEIVFDAPDDRDARLGRVTAGLRRMGI